MKQSRSKSIFAQRIFEIANVNTQTALATVLGKNQSSISDVLSEKKKIPFEWFYALFEKFNANPLWIIYGEGDKFTEKFPLSSELYKEYCGKNKHFDEHTPLSLFPNNDEKRLFTTAESENIFLDTNIAGKDLLDNNCNNALFFATGFNDTKLSNPSSPIFSYDELEPYKPKIINYSNNLKQTNCIRFYKFDSECMEPEVSSGILWINHDEILDFDSNNIYAFLVEGFKLTLARVKLENNVVCFIFTNSNFPSYSCSLEQARKDYLGKAIQITKALN